VTTLYYPPKFDSGLAGAKLHFTQTGTSTPQNVYTNEALTIAHSNPVVADASGVFAPIYLDPTLPSYRVLFTTAADVTIYQVDGIPSNQNIQQSIRLESTNPFLFLYDTDGTSGSRKYRIRAAGDAFEVQSANDAESVFTTIIKYQSGILYSNATEVAVTSSGTFTGTLSTGFAVAPTGTVNYRKINNVVTLWTNSAIGGTSNGTGLEMTGLPAALIPATAKTVLTAALQNNSNYQHCGEVTITAGGLLIFRLARTDITANFVRNGASSFTNSGGKGIEGGWTITYGLD
jgi:hypothetical protein